MNQSYLYVGDRFYVLEEMYKRGLNVTGVLVMANSYLQKEVTRRDIKHTLITSKKQLIDSISQNKFDVLISSGCKYIIPVSKITKGTQRFLNLHPSLLPDLKGKSPISGAVLFDKPIGATCHIMTDGIDDGPIVSQVKVDIKNTTDLDLYYHLAFMAEIDAFNIALKRNFQPLQKQNHDQGNYFSHTDDDMNIKFDRNNKELISQIKAFGTASKGAFFLVNGQKLKVFDGSLFSSSFLSNKFVNSKDNSIVMAYGDNAVVKRKTEFLLLSQIHGDLSLLKVGLLLK